MSTSTSRHLTFGSTALPRPGFERHSAGSLSYLACGPADGPLVVLVHGWPATAATWEPQLRALAEVGYRVVAPDMRGYGHSWAPHDTQAYALRHLVADLTALLDSLNRDSAVWVGHDWGAAVVWALAAHHPDRCDAVAALVVPYRTLDRGLDTMLRYVNRAVYPESRYPYAQFDYMAFYEDAFDAVTAQFDAAPDRVVRALYRPGNPAILAERSPRSTVTHDGGWFGGGPVPDIDRDTSILSDTMYADLVSTLRANGFFGPNSYYLHHADNLRYSETSVNGGVLTMPVLFVESRYDPTADTVRSALAEPMRQYCPDLTEVSFPAGHWVGLEKAAETNAALADWLRAIGRAP
ncbi:MULTISPECIES: alpha/beta fold hydrolase [unclassified Mycolicibacterium]|uniref:alpha/beta fold hydrolase n=1 Tax=unclassified Mycolicibacterium TaxID=2636767 RepID=UPI002ED8A87C